MGRFGFNDKERRRDAIRNKEEEKYGVKKNQGHHDKKRKLRELEDDEFIDDKEEFEKK